MLFILGLQLTHSPHDSRWWALEPEPIRSHFGWSWTWTDHDLNPLLFEEHRQLKCGSSSFNSKQSSVGSLVLKRERAGRIEPGIKKTVRDQEPAEESVPANQQGEWAVNTNGFPALSVVYQGICKLCPQERVFAYIYVPEYSGSHWFFPWMSYNP